MQVDLKVKDSNTESKYEAETKDIGLDIKILESLYSKKNDGKYHDVSQEFDCEKYIIDNYAIGLKESGYVATTGVISSSALTKWDDPNDANYSNCKITRLGIEYYENYINNKMESKEQSIVKQIIIGIVIAVISGLLIWYVTKK